MPVYSTSFFFFQAEDGIRDYKVTGVQTCALPISPWTGASRARWGAIAAAAALVLAGTAVWRLRAPAAVPSEYATARGQRVELSFSDGSRVLLGVDSRLRVPGDYGVRERVVELEGQAYFVVRHDARRPFRVRTRRGTTEDLGTAFDVRAYREESYLQVVVAAGRVALRGARGDATDSVALTLKPRDRAVIDARGNATTTAGVSLKQYLAWTRGALGPRSSTRPARPHGHARARSGVPEGGARRSHPTDGGAHRVLASGRAARPTGVRAARCGARWGRTRYAAVRHRRRLEGGPDRADPAHHGQRWLEPAVASDGLDRREREGRGHRRADHGGDRHGRRHAVFGANGCRGAVHHRGRAGGELPVAGADAGLHGRRHQCRSGGWPTERHGPAAQAQSHRAQPRRGHRLRHRREAGPDGGRVVGVGGPVRDQGGTDRHTVGRPAGQDRRRAGGVELGGAGRRHPGARAGHRVDQREQRAVVRDRRAPGGAGRRRRQ